MPPTSDRPLIPVCDLAAQFHAHEADLRAAIDRVLQRGWFILGEELASFEREFAEFARAEHAIGVANGTDAIHLALRAVGVGPGDRVLTQPNSAVPTAAAILEAGATPIFSDVDPATGIIDPLGAERALDTAVADGGGPVRAILPVHLYGRCAPMEAIEALAAGHDLAVIEDAAQAHGATRHGRTAGTMGRIGCFSFYPSKNLGAYGDAGACVTRDPDLAARLRRLRNYGEQGRYDSVEVGFNSRLDEMQAAILRAKLPHLAAWNRKRRELAAEYRLRLQGLPLLLPPVDDDGIEVAHLFVTRVARRDRLRAELERQGVGTQVHYPRPIHLQPAYAWLGLPPGSFPAAELRASQLISLPLYPEMTDETLDLVTDAVTTALRGEDPPAARPA